MSTEIRAQNSIALTSVKAIVEATELAQESADSAQSSAEQALNDASSAQESAASAYRSAETAINQLSIVENVVGVLDLVAEHGEYSLTADTEVRPNKWYFTRTGTDPNYVYQVVVDPTGDPSTEGWYELTSIDEAIQNYVSSQLVVDESGLWLKTAGANTRILLSPTDGVVLYGTDGTVVGKYGSVAQIGNTNGFNIRIGGANNEIGFFQGSNRAAYINGQELYVENSLSFGNFIFYQRQNGHFTLKLV